MSEHDLLFQSLQVGNLTLPNRVVMTTVKLGYSNLKGDVTERHIAFYVRRAQGNVALLTTEPMYVQLNGRELPTQLGIYVDALVPGLRQLTDAMLIMFAPYLDAANVDLKAFNNATYKRYVGARLQPVLDSMKTMKRLGIWLEVTTLVIPGLNDDPAEIRDAAAFVAQELGPETPWHISRFHPAYKMLDRSPTPIETLKRAKEIGLEEGLKFVYVGNVPSAGDENTCCPKCGRVLIQRHGFGVLANHVQGGHCPDCGASIAGIGMDWKANNG